MSTELGFIRRHIPGLASPIFAEKLRSVYWLNLNHLQLSPADDVVSVVVHKKAADQDIDYKFLAGVRLDRNSFLGRGEWAAEYLKHRLSADYMSKLKGDAFTRFASYEHVASAIRQIQQDMPVLVIRLQGAIRQRRYRSDSNGRQPITFTLTNETIDRLHAIAQKQKKDETATITSLIEEEGKALNAERDYKRQLKESVARKLAIANQQSALFEAQLDETLKYTERYLTLLARWELMWPDETPPTASDEDVSKLVESKMKDLKDKLAYIAFRDAVTTDRGHDER